MFSQALEKAINAYLALDPEIKTHWQPLKGHVLQLLVQPLDLSIYLQFSADGVHILDAPPQKIDTVIKGTPLTFLQSSFSKQIPKNLMIEGNIEVGKMFSDVLQQIDIDWEEQLSPYIGDVPANQLSKLVKKTRIFIQNSAASLQQNLTEYLQEEIQLLPSRLMVADFCQDVDKLRDDVERLAAKIELLVAQKGK